MRPFASALAHSDLEHLALGCASITAAGASALASALHSNSSLRLLELQHKCAHTPGRAAAPQPCDRELLHTHTHACDGSHVV